MIKRANYLNKYDKDAIKLNNTRKIICWVEKKIKKNKMQKKKKIETIFKDIEENLAK